MKGLPPFQRLCLSMLGFFLLSVSAGGHLQCTCSQPNKEPLTTQEPLSNPEPDSSEQEAPFECVDLLNQSCQTDKDCHPPQPKYSKPECPRVYCGDPYQHNRNSPVNPAKKGTLRWDPSFYPPRESCSCRVTCSDYECLNGTCQVPLGEPSPEPPPPPDIPPACPGFCTKDSDCPENLCQDRVKCIGNKCTNPLVRP